MINRKYVPNNLTKKDRKKQMAAIQQSRKAYKRGIYKTRKTLKSFISRPSSHVERAKRKFGVDSIDATPELARKSGCPLKALKAIIKKGEGAYYSSGSRPNQTAQSWARARLASALTSGKAAKVDAHILKTCQPPIGQK
jgi:hypothetical protein